jgi:hypothetical protein
MKLFETDPKHIIMFVVFGVVALMILGSLSTGTNAWTYQLLNVNTTSSAVTTIAGTVIPILFFVAVVLKLL